MTYIKILILGAALYIFLRSVYTLFTLLAGKRKTRIIFLRIFPLLEMILWLAYAFWVSYQLFNESQVNILLTGSLIIALVAIFGWYLLRDFISGTILKAENTFEPGETIITPIASGKIKKAGYRSLELETNEGDNIKIPFSLLSDQKLIRPADKTKKNAHYFILKIPARFPAEVIQKAMVNRALEMPWILTGENIEVKLKNEDPESFIAEIRYYSLSNDLAMKAENNLKEYAGKVFPND